MRAVFVCDENFISKQKLYPRQGTYKNVDKIS